MRGFAIVLSFLSLISFDAFGQKRPLFIGIEPSVTQEPYYSKGEFDVNICPFVFQRAINQHIDTRITTVVNQRFGGKNTLALLGIQLVAPVFLAKQEKTSPHHGFYLGPVVGLGTNRIEHQDILTLAIEPGYMFKPESRFTLSLGPQFGSSYFIYDSGANSWNSHFGIKVNLGLWFGHNKTPVVEQRASFVVKSGFPPYPSPNLVSL